MTAIHVLTLYGRKGGYFISFNGFNRCLCVVVYLSVQQRISKEVNLNTITFYLSLKTSKNGNINYCGGCWFLKDTKSSKINSASFVGPFKLYKMSWIFSYVLYG